MVFTRLLFCFLAGPFSVAAQQLFALRDCLELAKANYPLIKAKNAQVMGDQNKFQSSKTEYLPSLLVGAQVNYGSTNSLSGAYYPNEGLSIGLSGGVRPQNIYTGVFGSFGTLEVDWRIFNFGKVTANVQASRSALQLSQADYDNEIFQHQVRTIDAYLLLLGAQKVRAAQAENLDRAEKVRLVTRAEAGSGLRAGADSSFAAAEVSKAKLLFLESQKNEHLQRIRLAELIGESGSQIQVDTSFFLATTPFDFLADSAEVSASPLLKYHRAQIEYRRARSVAVKRSYAPSLMLSGIGFARGSGVSNKDDSFRTDFASGVGFQVANYLTVVSLRMNVLNYSRVHNDYRSEVHEMEKADYLYQEAALRMRKQLEAAEVQWNLARQQVLEAPVQLTAAQASYQQADARYQSGMVSLAELAQSFYVLNRAEVDKAIAFSNVWRALLMKAAATGDLSHFTSQIK